MFRVKLDPKTAITIEAAIPKIIVGLIMVTFSYAIAGFLIDLMWLFNNIIIQVFKGIAGPIPGVLRGFLPSNAVTDEFEMVRGIFATGLPAIVGGFLVLGLLPGLGWLAIVGLAIALIIIMLRIFWVLLKAYVSVILAVVFAPFQLMMGVLPGSNAFGDWIKNIISNLAVVPTILVMTFVASYLTMASFFAVTTNLGNLMNTYLTSATDPVSILRGIFNILTDSSLQAGVRTMFIFVFVSFGILMATPKAGDLIQSVMAGKAFAYGTAIGEALGPARLPFNEYGQRESASWQGLVKKGGPIPKSRQALHALSEAGRFAGLIKNP
jgi:hypothetical protein